jgi:hypothetical protein
LARTSGLRAAAVWAPILDALQRFHAEDTVSLAIPAHKSGAGAPSAVLTGADAREGGQLAATPDRLRHIQPAPARDGRGGDPRGWSASVSLAPRDRANLLVRLRGDGHGNGGDSHLAAHVNPSHAIALDAGERARASGPTAT